MPGAHADPEPGEAAPAPSPEAELQSRDDNATAWKGAVQEEAPEPQGDGLSGDQGNSPFTGEDVDAGGEPEMTGDEARSQNEKIAHAAAGLAADLAVWQEGESENREPEGKVKWFNSFLKRNGGKPGGRGNVTSAAPPTAPSAEPIPFPRPSAAPEADQPMSAEMRTLEEAREAVRGVFASLEPKPSGEFAFKVPPQPGDAFEAPPLFEAPPQYEPAQARNPEPERVTEGWETSAWDANAPTDAGADEEAGLSAWPAPRGASDSPTADEKPTPIEEDGPTAETHPWLKSWREAPREEAADPDAGLRDALRAHFLDAPPAPSPVLTPLEEPDAPDEAVRRSIIERFSATWKRAPAAGPELVRQQPAETVEEPETAGGEEAAFDPRLYREIEETREHGSPERRREGRGGLALAAAWGLFVCIASGLIIGFFAFRDIAAGTMPGLAALYRALGMPVTVQPLIFESVQYEWTVEDYKPVLVIKGAVYNRGRRDVKVPDFVITIKDDDPALDKEYSANLNFNTAAISPEQRGDFQIELQSPSPSITAVELELRNVR
jgi:hypothetical protein